jgi:fatty acid-binding protein DegV
MLGLQPLFALEERHLSPSGKARTLRHLLESFRDFAEQFNHPSHIGLIKAANTNHFRPSSLRQYVEERFPNVSFSQHVINAPLPTSLGLKSIGVVAMETANK